MPYKVELDYMKPDTGTYYSSGNYVTTHTHLHEIHREVQEMAQRRKLPGLTEGHSPFIVSINVVAHPNNHPKLILTDKLPRLCDCEGSDYGGHNVDCLNRRT